MVGLTLPFDPLTDEDRAAWFDWQVNRLRDWALWGALEARSFPADRRDADLMHAYTHHRATCARCCEAMGLDSVELHNMVECEVARATGRIM